MPEADERIGRRTWIASRADGGEVTRMMVAFRDWWERDEPSEESFAAGVARLLEDPGTEFLLAADGERTVGVCQLRYRHGLWYDAPDCWLEDIFVDENARGIGIGRSLVEAAIERAERRGCRRVQLDVSEANAEALALYRGLGFDEIQDPPGARLLLMTRWL